jgi:hypothetical protein
MIAVMFLGIFTAMLKASDWPTVLWTFGVTFGITVWILVAVMLVVPR